MGCTFGKKCKCNFYTSTRCHAPQHLQAERGRTWREMWNVNFATALSCSCWLERLWTRRTATLASVKNYTSISCQTDSASVPDESRRDIEYRCIVMYMFLHIHAWRRGRSCHNRSHIQSLARQSSSVTTRAKPSASPQTSRCRGIG